MEPQGHIIIALQTKVRKLRKELAEARAEMEDLKCLIGKQDVVAELETKPEPKRARKTKSEESLDA